MTDLERLRLVARADVYKAGILAASLDRASNFIELRYLSDYLADGGAPIATTLPLDAEPVVAAGGALPPFFAGLLPEGRRLSVLRRALKTSADDDLSLLLAVGGDTVGDVVVIPAGEAPHEVRPLVQVEQWSDVRFSDLVTRSTGLDTADPLVDEVGLAGVQPKLSNQLLSLPVADRSGRWMLKLTPPEYPYMVENEAFFLDAARSAGLEVAHHEVVIDSEGQRGLLVRRFDRHEESDGSIRSLAQEDGCQVLGRYPAAKYNVTSEAVVSALVTRTRAQGVSAVDLLRQLVFAYLTGDGDVHAKNLSIGARPSGEWRVTPAYDLPSTRPYADKTLALSIGGRVDGLTGRHLVDFAEQVGVPSRAATNLLDLLCDHADTWITRLSELPFDEGRIRTLTRLARHRQSDLRRR